MFKPGNLTKFMGLLILLFYGLIMCNYSFAGDTAQFRYPETIHLYDKNKYGVIFDNYILYNKAWLMRFLGNPLRLTIASGDYHFNRQKHAMKVRFPESNNSKVKMVGIYKEQKKRIIPAHIAKAKLANEQVYVADLTGDALINFKIHKNFKDEAVNESKKALKQQFKKHEKFKRNDNSKVNFTRKLDDVLVHVITPSQFPATDVLIEDESINLVYLAPNVEKKTYLTDYIAKNYPEPAMYPKLAVLPRHHVVFRSSNYASIDDGWFYEASKWCMASCEKIVDHIIGGVSQKWNLN